MQRNSIPGSSSGLVAGRDRFATLALGYLLLPSLFFLLTWVRLWIGLPLALVVVTAFVCFYRGNKFVGEACPKLSAGSWVFILVMAFIWTFFAGAGGFVPQVSDYEKHNLVFHDLMQQSWPVKYVNGPVENYLCYGLGYYLVPTFIARIAGENLLPLLMLLWAFIGVALFFYWVALQGRSPKKTLAIVLLFAATETLWHMFLHGLKHPALAGVGGKIDTSLQRLGIGPDYADSFISLQFRPQHVIVAWLGAALFYEMFWRRRHPRGAMLVWAACWFWSPLTSLGLLLVPLAAFMRWNWRAAFEPVNGCGAILLALLAVFFQGHVPLNESGPIWKFSEGAEWLVLYPCFLLLQLSPVFLLFWADRKSNLLDGLRPLFYGSALLLLLLPLYKIGYYGDLRLQAATPALLFVALAAARLFQSDEFSLKRPLCTLLIGSQLLGAAYPVGKWWWKTLNGGAVDYSYAATEKKYGDQNLSGFKRSGYDYASQYLGRSNSPAGRWLLR